MNRVVSLLLGLNNFTILERKTLTANDRNLQYMNIKIDDEIDIENYSLLIRYKQVDGKIFADVYSIKKDNDIQIPNSILEFPQTLTIEFCYISNKNDNRITIPRKLQLNVIDTYDTIVEPDDVVVGPSVADIIKEIPKKTEEGKTEIEKSKDEAIEELKNHSDSNVEESKEQINSFTSQKQEQLDVYTNVKKSQLDEYTTTKNMDIDSHTAEKKNELNAHEKAKEKELDNYVTTVNKPELDKYTKAKEGELDTHTGKKKSELDVYEKAKEGQLDSHTNTKKEELNQHTIQKQGQLDEYTVAKEGELDSHTIEKKNELNAHEKSKEKELDSYATTVNKPELDKYTNIKKEELNAHIKTKESEITQVTETKKQEITAHGASELDKFNQGAKQEADKQIGRVVAEGDVQVQRVKDESTGVIPRIEQLENGKVSNNGDTMTGYYEILSRDGLSHIGIGDSTIKFTTATTSGTVTADTNSIYLFNNTDDLYHILRLANDGTTELTANNLKTSSKEVVSAVNSIYDNINTSLTLDSPIGNHVVLKRAGELKGSLTANQDGIAIYNEKSGKMIELKDDGKVLIPENSGQYIGYRRDLDEEGFPPGWYVISKGSSINKPLEEFGILKEFYEEGSSGNRHQLWFTTTKSGEIYHRRISQDWVRMANENDINELKQEIAELRSKIDELRAEIQKLKGE